MRILRHSSAERRVDGEPLVKLAANEERRDSVPWRGRLRSVDGRMENRWFKAGSVNVERICMYNDSNWIRSWLSLSSSRLIATRYNDPCEMITNLVPLAEKLFRVSFESW